MADRNEKQKHHPALHINHSMTTSIHVCALNISNVYTDLRDSIIRMVEWSFVSRQNRHAINAGWTWRILLFMDTQFKAVIFFYAEWLCCGQTTRASCRPFKSHVSVIKRKQSYTEEDEHQVYIFLCATLKLGTWKIQKRIYKKRQALDVECL